jgi:transcriptional regulator with XRE-family HTH domain
LVYGKADPTAARLLVGARLRKLRESARVTREDAGDAIRGSESKISRMELGRSRFKQRDVTDLLDLYGVTEDERATLLALAEHANAPAWWQAFGDVVPPWFEPYLGLEQAAGIIRTYEVQFVPGLLQTKDYARAVLQIGAGDARETETELRTNLRVDLRLRRQQILHRDNPTRLWAVIDEAALRRPIGGAAVMRAQIRHLIEIAQLIHVNIQVAPFSAGGQATAGGPITKLRFHEDELPDVVYLEQLMGAVYLGRPAEKLYHWIVLNRLATEAPPPAETTGILQRILSET